MNKINENELKKFFIEIKKNNKSKFEEFYLKYNKLIYGVAFSIVKNKPDTEDIVQIAFTKIYTLEKEKLPSEKYASWLYSLAKNEAISFLRTKRNNVKLEDIYELENENNEINKIIEEDRYKKIISKLNSKEQEIVSLKILSNFSFNEISKMLNLPSSTVKWKYYKALHTLELLIGNICMFILTFIISLKNIFTKHKEIPKKEHIQNEQSNQNTDVNRLNEDSENKKMEDQKDFNSIIVNNIIENSASNGIIVNEEIDINTNNQSLNLIMLGISGIFLMCTIIFSVFLIKYQLKSKNKTSK